MSDLLKLDQKVLNSIAKKPRRMVALIKPHRLGSCDNAYFDGFLFSNVKLICDTNQKVEGEAILHFLYFYEENSFFRLTQTTGLKA